MTFRPALVPLPAVALACLAISLGANGARGADWAAAHAAAKQATFDVLVEDRHQGTGFCVESTGYALTAAHVVAIANRRLEVLLGDGTRLAATVVARDLGHDLALLRLPEREAAYPVLAIAAEEPVVGEEIAVFGTPLYRRQLLLFGRVSSDELGFEFLGGRQHYVECRHVTGIGPKGTSGGPWINYRGEAVGVQVGGIHLASGWQGVAFVAPAVALRELVETKRERPTPTIRVAIEETWQQPEEFFATVPPRTEGLVVKVLDQNGPAAAAGVLIGDVIVSADEKPMKFIVDLLRLVRSKGDGESVTLEILGRNLVPNRLVKVPVHSLVEGTTAVPR